MILTKKQVLFFLSIISYCTPTFPDYRPASGPSPFYLSIDYLFWKPEQEQLNFFAVTDSTNGIITEGDQSFKGSSGVRAAGRFLFDTGWNVSLAWTHFTSCSSSNVQAGTDSSLIPTLIFASSGAPSCSQASSSWSVRLESADLELGQLVCPLKSFDVRPYCGIKWAKINQLQSISYTGFPTSSDTLAVLMQRINTFSGVGPRVGIDETINISRCLNLVGSFSAAALYGIFNTTTPFVITTTTGTVTPAINSCKKRLRPMLDMLLGLEWEQTCNNITVELGAAYEVQYWWGQWQAPSLFGVETAIPTNGDFMTHGLTLHLGLRF